MDITINELGQLTPDSYILLDMRGDVEVGHGIIPGAIHMSKEEILEKYSGGLVKADEAEAAEREDSAEKKRFTKMHLKYGDRFIRILQ